MTSPSGSRAGRPGQSEHGRGAGTSPARRSVRARPDGAGSASLVARVQTTSRTSAPLRRPRRPAFPAARHLGVVGVGVDGQRPARQPHSRHAAPVARGRPSRHLDDVAALWRPLTRQALVVDAEVGDQPDDPGPRVTPPTPPLGQVAQQASPVVAEDAPRWWGPRLDRRPASGQRSATASARVRARRWSSASRSTMVSSATSRRRPTPTWRIAPPSRLRSSPGPGDHGGRPSSSDPTGAPRPFDRHDVTVVAAAGGSARARWRPPR